MWFYAIYLFIATRHGVSGKELQRTLGVTYKTAWRIGHQIRDLMDKVDSFQTLKGHVEIDETYFGGYRPRSQGGKDAANKTIIMGMKERGGRIETKIIPNVKTATLRRYRSGKRRKGLDRFDRRTVGLQFTQGRWIRSRRG